MNKQLSVSVVIPMYNEKECICYTVKELRKGFFDECVDFEIVVVDDGSTDGSFFLVNDLCKYYSFLRIIHFDKNRGIGSALKAGFKSAKNSIIIYTDSDLPVDIATLKRGLNILNDRDDLDMVIGYRHGRRESVMRYIYTYVFNGVIRRLFKVKFRDINCAMKIFRRSVIENMILRSEGPFIDAELVVRARNRGVKIFELKINEVPRAFGYSKFASRGTIVKTIIKMNLELISFLRTKDRDS